MDSPTAANNSPLLRRPSASLPAPPSFNDFGSLVHDDMQHVAMAAATPNTLPPNSRMSASLPSTLEKPPPVRLMMAADRTASIETSDTSPMSRSLSSSLSSSFSQTFSRALYEHMKGN